MSTAEKGGGAYFREDTVLIFHAYGVSVYYQNIGLGQSNNFDNEWIPKLKLASNFAATTCPSVPYEAKTVSYT